MSWRDRYLPASFRGVPFKIVDNDREGGRKKARHDAFKREAVYFEDLGRRAKEWKLEGVVLGADYDELRDRLIDALEEAGPGELVHPSYGPMTVEAMGYTVSERTSEAGVARFALHFVEASSVTFPTVTALPGARIEAAAAALDLAAAGEFAELVVTAGLPAFVAEPLVNGAGDLAERVSKLDLQGIAAKVAAVRDRAAELADKVLDRVAHPSGFAEDLQALFDSILAAAGSRELALEAYLSLGKFRAQSVSGSTPLQASAAQNADAFENLTRSAAAAGAVRAASGITFETFDDAVRARARLLDDLDQLAGELGDTSYAELADLRAELVDGVPSEAEDLPRLDVFVPPAVLPALVIAWRLYGDRDRDVEIVARNRVANPGFVPVTPLEVKSA